MSKTKALYEYKISRNRCSTDNLNIEITEDFVYIEEYDNSLKIWYNCRIPIQIWNSIIHNYNVKLIKDGFKKINKTKV